MRSVLIVAGEDSGDLHGAGLVREFKKRQPSFSFFGIGGRHLAAQGVRLIYTVRDIALVGFFEILGQLPRVWRILHRIRKETSEQRPAAAVLIDSPDFNLRLARLLKKMGIPVLYYVSPTVWAWRRKRLRLIKKHVDKMLLIFPFEEEIYSQAGIPAVYIGHPFQERIRLSLEKEAFFSQHRLDSRSRWVALLPGSRKSELRNHMPTLIQAAGKLHEAFGVRFLLCLAENLDQEDISPFLPHSAGYVHLLKENRYEAMAYSELVLASCGSANLEAALLNTPVVAFYRIFPLTYALGKGLVRIPHYSIVNILAGEKIIPELIQQAFTTENLFQEAAKIMESPAVQRAMKARLAGMSSLLGKRKASSNAARELERLVEE